MLLKVCRKSLWTHLCVAESLFKISGGILPCYSVTTKFGECMGGADRPVPIRPVPIRPMTLRFIFFGRMTVVFPITIGLTTLSQGMCVIPGCL